MSDKNKILFIDDTQDAHVSLCCPVCDYVLRDLEDITSCRDNKCCVECWLTFGQSDRERWNSGWRPDQEKLNRYKSTRKILNSSMRKILEE